jgi:hypothetical protein
MKSKYTVFKKETNAGYFRRARALMHQQLEETRETLRNKPGSIETITNANDGVKRTTYSFLGILTTNNIALQGSAYIEGKTEILAEITADGKLPRVLRKVRKSLENLGFREIKSRFN